MARGSRLTSHKINPPSEPGWHQYDNHAWATMRMEQVKAVGSLYLGNLLYIRGQKYLGNFGEKYMEQNDQFFVYLGNLLSILNLNDQAIWVGFPYNHYLLG